MKIVLQRHSSNLWKLFVKDNGAFLSQRLWSSKNDALEWAKNFMSNHNQPYEIEVVDELQSRDK